MPSVRSNGIDIEYDEFGAPGDPPMLLVMGLAMQMIGWPDPFCEKLAAHGFRVIRFDNRDVGLSTKFPPASLPGPIRMRLLAAMGRGFSAPYTLHDMAQDAVGLLDQLDVASVHLVGASMGGMISQLLAISHPDRVRTLTSVMSSSGHPALPPPYPSVIKRMVLDRPSGEDPEAMIEYSVRFKEVIGSPDYPEHPDETRARTRRYLERNFSRHAFNHHMAAILRTGNRSRRLRDIRVPTLVVHGAADRMVPPIHGRHTARCIPGARLEIIPGMGHDLPTQLHERLAALVAEHAQPHNN